MISMRTQLLTLLFLTVGITEAQFGARRVLLDQEFSNVHFALAADIDSDGDQDAIVYRSSGEPTLLRFLNPGDGLFRQGEGIELNDLSMDFMGFAIVDMNGDGHLDIVSKAMSTPVRFNVLVNTGSGAFGQSIPLVQLPADYRATGTLAGDVDSDGDMDLVAWGGGLSGIPKRFYLLRNQGALSLGQPEVILEFASGSFDPAVDLADIDNDGDLDLLFARPTTSVLMGWHENDGTGEFSDMIPFPSDLNEVTSITAGDMDADGVTDLVVGSASVNKVGWYRGLGNGSFASPTVLLEDVDGTCTVNVVDWDSDGDADILASYNGRAFIFANSGTGIFSPREMQGAYPFWSVSEAVDMDGDGSRDLLLETIVDEQSLVTWWREDDPLTGLGTFLPFASDCNTGPDAVAWGDIDGDGDVDIIADSDKAVTCFVNEGTAGYRVGQVILGWIPGTQVHQLGLWDLDGDGDLDLLGTALGNVRSWCRNDGTGRFTPMLAIPTTASIIGYSVGDLNNDGEPDLMTVGPGSVNIKLNQGDATAWTDIVIVSANMDVGFIAPVDVDIDGDLDVVFALSDEDVPSSDLVGWAMNDGSGGFTMQDPISDIRLESMHMVDIDTDGHVDILATSPASGIIWMRATPGVGFDAPITIHGTPDQQIFPGDIDQDGRVDIVYRSVGVGSMVPRRWIRNLGDGLFDAPQTIVTTRGATALFDADGDMDPDLINVADGSVVEIHENLYGSPYRIQGHIFWDENANGTFDVGEQPMSRFMVGTSSQQNTTLTLPNGAYSIVAQSGGFEVTPMLGGIPWTFTPGSGPVHVDLDPGSPIATGIDFGLVPSMDTTILALSLAESSGPCGTEGAHTLSLTNFGTTRPSGRICYTLDATYEYISSTPAPAFISGNTYCWEYEELDPYSALPIVLWAERPSVDFLGSVVSNQLSATEEDLSGNIITAIEETYFDTVRCSFDPNDKQVHPVGFGMTGALPLTSSHLDYTIRFQNTGTATATNVFIADRLQVHLDPTRIQVLNYSHEPSAVDIQQDDLLIVRFNGINLPDSGTSQVSSQGFISLRIGVAENVTHITSITNTAEIHFDQNEAVVTNTTLSTLVDCDLWQPWIEPIPAGGGLMTIPGESYQWYVEGEEIETGIDRFLFPTTPGTYTVRVISMHGCDSASPPYAVVITDVQASTEPRFAILPNPFTATARLVCNEVLTPAHGIELLDLHGRVLSTQVGNGSQEVLLERSGLAQGVYVVRISHEGQRVGTARVMVE